LRESSEAEATSIATTRNIRSNIRCPASLAKFLLDPDGVGVALERRSRHLSQKEMRQALERWAEHVEALTR